MASLTQSPTGALLHAVLLRTDIIGKPLERSAKGVESKKGLTRQAAESRKELALLPLVGLLTTAQVVLASHCPTPSQQTGLESD